MDITRQTATITLSNSALKRGQFGSACFEIAHECIHCLSPVEMAEVTYLEEGIASWFADRYANDRIDCPIVTSRAKYQEAMGKVTELLHQDPNIIQKLRKVEPFLSCISYDTLTSALYNVTPKLARYLTSLFYL